MTSRRGEYESPGRRTLFQLRYGEVNVATSLRPTLVSFGHPEWTVAGPIGERVTNRYVETPTKGGTFIQPLGRSPYVVTMRLTLRPVVAAALGDYIDILQTLRQLPGQPLQFTSNPFDYGDFWYMRDLVIEDNDLLLLPDLGGAQPRIGGFFPLDIPVTFSLFADRPDIQRVV